jgi:N-acetyltransferase
MAIGAAAGTPRYDPAPFPWVSPVTLEGARVRLEPLSIDHLEGLGDVAFEPSIWRWTVARPANLDGLGEWVEAALRNAEAGTELPFATIDRASGRPVGSTRFLSIVPEHRRLEIGWTWLGTKYQRTGINCEAKYLQMEHAFTVLGANRVEFKTDSENARARAGLLGIGATFEGIFRDHMVMPDHRIRHSAWYSVIAEDWPDVRAKLHAALGLETSSTDLP